MSTDARSRETLRDISNRMSAPLPRRTRFLAELATDLHELTERLVEAGHPYAEARRRAEDAMVPDAAALAALERIHASWYRRLTSRIAPSRLGRIERGAVVVLTTVVLLTGAVTLAGAGLWSDPSSFLWPVLALGAAIVATTLTKTFQLWIKRDHSSPRGGLHVIPVLVGATLIVAIAGLFVDSISMAAAIEAAPENAAPIFFAWLTADAALLSVAILTSMFGGLAWLLTSHWLVRIEDAHERALRLPDTLKTTQPPR